MCFVSAVHDYGREHFDLEKIQQWIQPYKSTIEAAKKLDEATGQKDCESEEKTAWMKKIEEKMKEIAKEESKKAITSLTDKLTLKSSNHSDEYQLKTRETAIYPGQKELKNGNLNCLIYLALAICGESGEISEKVKKIIRDKNGKFDENDLLKIKDEIGDVLYYLTRLLDEMDYPLSKAMEDNISKLRSRKERGKIGGSGDER